MPMTDNDVVAGFWIFARVVLFLVLSACVLAAAWYTAGVVSVDLQSRILVTGGFLAIWVSLVE